MRIKLAISRLLRKLRAPARGAVTIFLAICISPILTTTAFMLELNRLNSVVSILDELIGVSAISTLANYDEFLKDRFGLLAVTQDHELDEIFGTYFDVNVGIMGNAINAERTNFAVSGAFPLSDIEVLNRQIMEFSAFNAPLTLVDDLLISGVIKKLESLGNIGTMFSFVGNSADLADNALALVDSFENLQEQNAILERKKTEYTNSFNNFSNAVRQLAEALQNQPEPLDDDDATEEEIDEREQEIETHANTITNLTNTVRQRRDAYLALCREIRTLLAEYIAVLDASDAAVQGIVSSAYAAGSDLFALSQANTVDELQNSVNDFSNALSNHEGPINDAFMSASNMWAQESINLGMHQTVQDIVGNIGSSGASNKVAGARSELAAAIQNFDTQIQRIQNELPVASNNFFINNNNYANFLDGLDANWFHFARITGYIPDGELDDFATSQGESIATSGILEMLGAFIAIFDRMMGMDLFFNRNLTANLDLGYYAAMGGLPGFGNDSMMMEVVDAFIRVNTSAASVIEAIGSARWYRPFSSLRDIIRSVRELFRSIRDLIDTIIYFFRYVARNIIDLFTDYERWLLTIYSAYNMPARTDFLPSRSAGETMTGISFNQWFAPSGSFFNDLVLGGNMFTQANAWGHNALRFDGAMLEYIMFGSPSEIANQLYTFFALFLFRLALSLPAVLANPFVQSIAGKVGAVTFGIGYPIMLVVFILMEALMDTFLLVNGAKTPFIKLSPFVSPLGLVDFLSRLGGLILATDKDGLQNILNGVMDLGSEATAAKNHVNLDYRAYCFLLMLVLNSREQQLASIQNIIQMEAYYHYNGRNNVRGFGSRFMVREAYTFVDVRVEPYLFNFIPVMDTSGASLFIGKRRLERRQVRGF